MFFLKGGLALFMENLQKIDAVENMPSEYIMVKKIK